MSAYLEFFSYSKNHSIQKLQCFDHIKSWHFLVCGLFVLAFENKSKLNEHSIQIIPWVDHNKL